MNNKKRNILTNGWGERLLLKIAPHLEKYAIIGLRKDLDIPYSDYTTYRKLSNVIDEFDIVHYNSWFDIFQIYEKNPTHIIIFQSHALHPGLDNTHADKIIESRIIRTFLWCSQWLFRIIFQKNIENVDAYLVSTPGFLDAAQKIRTDALWIPNPVDIIHPNETTIELNPEKINIFYPTGLRAIKNPRAAFELLIKLHKKYGEKLAIYLFRQKNELTKKWEKELEILKDSIVWVEGVENSQMGYYYGAKWDLVIGSLYPKKPYAILNMIELESISYKLPILAIDLYEVLLYEVDDIEKVALRLLEDPLYKEKYIEKNYAYIARTHAPEVVASVYEVLIDSLYEKKYI